MKIAHEEFVRIWQESSNLVKAAERTQLTRLAASSRATLLRRAGVRLKRFHHTPVGPDVDALNKICKETKEKK